MTTRALPPSGAQTREVAVAVNALLDGKVNSVGQVTLAQGASETQIHDRRISAQTVLLLCPLTQSAAVEVWYVSSRASGVVTVSHTNTADADKHFAYTIFG